MAVSISTTDNRPSNLELIKLSTAVTALSSASAVAGSYNALSNAVALDAAQQALVIACLNSGRLQAAAVISSCSISAGNTKGAGPQAGGSTTPAALIAALTALRSANPLMDTSGAITSQINDVQQQQVFDALANGTIKASVILSTMS